VGAEYGPHPDELDGAEFPVAKFSTHFFDARPSTYCLWLVH
jgi:hypothetical protein